MDRLSVAPNVQTFNQRISAIFDKMKVAIDMKMKERDSRVYNNE